MDNVVSQQIPHDSEAEKAVLGAVFLDPEAIIDASDILQPDDFYEHANRIVFQAMLNIWVVTNTIPNTGISLPFFSYGGTSLLILLAEMGIVLSVSRAANIEKS